MEKPILADLAIRFSSDKYYNHSYIETYQRLFTDRKVHRLLEIGIGYQGLMQPFLPSGVQYCHGSSLHMWAEYWPDADIYACDIRKDTLINEGRIRSLVCDQSSGESLANMVFEFTEGLMKTFDVVIGDGSHDFEHQKLTASVLLPRVTKGGVYIIEDTYPDKGAELAAAFSGVLIIGDKRPDDCLVVMHR